MDRIFLIFYFFPACAQQGGGDKGKDGLIGKRGKHKLVLRLEGSCLDLRYLYGFHCEIFWSSFTHMDF